ncbi:hypothetical protein PENSPDRAFT_740136 [Peniophora sp. CONT]|nr:hypothetical protein PENSPDRAFT_740136 [Peniophora sp. CONT]
MAVVRNFDSTSASRHSRSHGTRQLQLSLAIRPKVSCVRHRFLTVEVVQVQYQPEDILPDEPILRIFAALNGATWKEYPRAAIKELSVPVLEGKTVEGCGSSAEWAGDDLLQRMGDVEVAKLPARAPALARTSSSAHFASARAAIISFRNEAIATCFAGSLTDTHLARQALNDLPSRPAVLRKDFILIVKAHPKGADSVLVIAAMLSHA